MQALSLIEVINIGEGLSDSEMGLAMSLHKAYPKVRIEFKNVDITTYPSQVSYHKSIAIYEASDSDIPRDGTILSKIVFRIGDTSKLNPFNVSGYIDSIIEETNKMTEYNEATTLSILDPSVAVKPIVYNPPLILSTKPIGGCWYAYRGGDLCSCFDKLYTNSCLFAYVNSPHGVLYWIDESNTPQNLYAANKTYYTIHLSEKVTGTVIDNTPIVYNGTTIGKTIYIEENRAIIDLDCIPVPYDSFDYFVRDVESFDAQYGYDGILRIIPKLKASVVKDTSPVELDILPGQEVGGVALVLIVINDDIVNDGIELQTANTINTYSLNIFGWLHDIRPTFRMFVNSDTIFNKSLDNIEFDSIVIIDAESSTVIDRALSLHSKEVRTLFNYSSDSYNFKYDYINTNSYEDKTYIVTRKENKEDDKSE